MAANGTQGRVGGVQTRVGRYGGGIGDEMPPGRRTERQATYQDSTHTDENMMGQSTAERHSTEGYYGS